MLKLYLKLMGLSDNNKKALRNCWLIAYKNTQKISKIPHEIPEILN